MKKIIFTTLALFAMSSYAQECNCASDFNWVKTTFEENDAGFSYVIDEKGKNEYEKHSEAFAQNVKNIDNHAECLNVIRDWFSFFRSGHIGIRPLAQQIDQNSNRESSEKEIIEQFKDSEKLAVDLDEFKTYIESKKETDYEGIWVSEPYKIGIKKVKDTYVGFIIEADGVYWTKGQIKLKINPDNSSVFYMRDHSEQSFDTTALLGNNYIQIGNISLTRMAPKMKSDPQLENYFKSLSATQPYFEKIDDKTTYLRIPSFGGLNKKIIDSVILSNKALILKTPNLIIDIKNNGGGADRCYSELLPILYTNPIRTVGVEFYSTSLNNQRMLDFINEPKYGFDEEGKKWAQESYDKLSKYPGEFVNLGPTVVNMTEFDTIHEYPKNIGVIINEGNGSTAEQFLLAAKQSRKVKLYGTTTAGVLDISNMYFVKSPCANFEFGYSLSRSMRIPGMTIDEKGIQPDYYLDRSIPKYEWTKFVSKSLSE